MRTMFILIVMVFVIGFGLVAYRILNAEHDPAVWHIDPLDAAPPPSPNGYRVSPSKMAKFPPDAEAPVYAGQAEVLAKAFDDFVLSQLFAERIAGSPEELWMTYVQRTPKLRVPDYISVKFIKLGEEYSTISIFSRSRFGNGDMGMNEKRTQLWLGTLKSFEVDPSEVPSPEDESETEEAVSE